MDGNISSIDFNQKRKHRKELTGLEFKLKSLKKTISPFKTFLNKKITMLENFVEYYKKAHGKTRKKILGYFSKKWFWRKESCNLRIHKTDTGTSQCQQGFQKSGHKKRGRK